MEPDRLNSPDTSAIMFDVLGHQLQFSQDPNSKHLGTTVWDASMVFAKFLEKNCRKGRFCPAKLKGKRVLELGAGCGVAGFDSFGSIEVAELNWGNENHIRAVDPPFDYIIGTDVGPDLVIHQKEECLDRMGEWCQEHHGASGLTEKALASTITEQEAEKQVIEFVKNNVGTYAPLLAGNSVYVDLLFLKKYMPELASLFSHVLVDVSSVKALCVRWYPRDNKKAAQKENKHRAMDDIKESIAQLKYYKDNIFKASSKSRK